MSYSSSYFDVILSYVALNNLEGGKTTNAMDKTADNGSLIYSPVKSVGEDLRIGRSVPVGGCQCRKAMNRKKLNSTALSNCLFGCLLSDVPQAFNKLVEPCEFIRDYRFQSAVSPEI